MVEIIKDVALKGIKDVWTPKGEVDLADETGVLFMKITLSCMFGKLNVNPPIT